MISVKNTKKNKKKKIALILSAIIIVMLISLYFVLDYYNILPQKKYYADDFNIDIIKSANDKNQNEVDDYTDILLGARKDAENHPFYVSKYYKDGYPPDNEGVCSDLVWRAFKNAGYDLKTMIDTDISKNQKDYPNIIKPDPNIDFRRVKNLKVFFDKYVTSLTLDVNDIGSWQPGDIVIFGKNYTHIAIISDIRNKSGIPWLIHNSGQPNREENAFNRYSNITGHYRFENPEKFFDEFK